MNKLIAFLRYVIDPRKLKAWVIFLEVTCCLIPLMACRAQHAKDTKRYEAEKALIISQYEAQIAALSERVVDIPEDEHKPEIEALARLIQGTTPKHSDSAKQALCWLVFNRTEHPIFPDSITGVIEQSGQFDTYKPDAVITEADYKLAKAELERFLNGDYRPVPPSFVYCVVTDAEVILRDEWDSTKAHEWRA